MIEAADEGRPGLAADILAFLKRENADYRSSKQLAESFSITRQSVYDAIAYLRGCGYQIDANRREGYRLVKTPDLLLPMEITAGLKCRTFGCKIFPYQSIGSTNIVAQELAKAGLPEGTLVIADKQTKGKGRLGRSWHSPPGVGLYFTLILRPNLSPDKIAGFSLVAGLAIVRAIKNVTGIETLTKWPNDVLYKSRKLAGVLVELVAELDKINFMVVGCGINVNHQKKDFPLRLQRKSISLKLIARKDISRILLLQDVLAQFENLYDNFCKHGFKYLRSELLNYSALINKRVTLSIGKEKVIGKVAGFDDVGRLIIKNKKGLMSYSAGEVSLR